jgi:hypothetical protein
MPSTSATTGWIPLPQAAHALGWTWPRTWNAMLAGRLEHRRKENGRWLVSVDCVQRLLLERAKSQLETATLTEVPDGQEQQEV